MFGKFKDKLKGWFKSSSEKIIEEGTVSKDTQGHVAEVVEIEQDVEREKKKKKEKREIEKAERIIEKAKNIDVQVVPVKYDEIKKKTIPDLEKIKKEADIIKKDIAEGKKRERKVKKGLKEIEDFNAEFERADKLIEDSKKEKIPVVPVKFDVGKEKYEPDLERIEDEKKGFFSRVKSSLSYKITEDEFNRIFDDLELLLLDNNVALEAVDDIREGLKDRLVGREIKRNELETEIKRELKKSIEEVLIEPDNPLDFIKIADKPFKILFFGINGTGKTTSVAKITNYLKKSGFSVVLAAGDTFRAASIEQISEHAKKLEVPLIKQDYGADPAAVGYDAVKYAEKHNIDFVLIDTAGRMHTKSNLMAEMEKIVRVVNPDLKIFVGESVAGNDAVEQAKVFHETVDIDGIILSKADIDDKGGTVISVSHATGKPVFYLGTGQGYDDLELFNKQKFIESLGL